MGIEVLRKLKNEFFLSQNYSASESAGAWGHEPGRENNKLVTVCYLQSGIVIVSS
jgi:hypothetical protein